MITTTAFYNHRLSRAAIWAVVLSRANSGDVQERTWEWGVLVDFFGSGRLRELYQAAVREAQEASARGENMEDVYWREAWRLGGVRGNA